MLFATGKSSNQQLAPRMHVDQKELQNRRFVEIPCADGAESNVTGQWVVSSGEIARCKTNANPSLPALSNELDLEGGTVLCVDPDTGVEVPDGTCGEIWICGQSIAGGYWQKPIETVRRHCPVRLLPLLTPFACCRTKCSTRS